MGTHRWPAECRLPTNACAGTTGYAASTCAGLAQCRVAPAHLHVAAVELIGEREHLVMIGVLRVLNERLPAPSCARSALLSVNVACGA